MVEMRYRFQCYDVADCDVVILSEFRESLIETVQSHMRDVHGEDLTPAEVEPLIEPIEPAAR